MAVAVLRAWNFIYYYIYIIIYTLDQLTEEESIGNPDERMVKINMAKRTVYERSPEDGKGNKDGGRTHKMIRSVTSTDRGTKNY